MKALEALVADGRVMSVGIVRVLRVYERPCIQQRVSICSRTKPSADNEDDIQRCIVGWRGTVR